MAAVRAKKPISNLKAGKKKSVNKWIIVAGVATVAIAGALIVRFSGASGYPFVRYSSQMYMSNSSFTGNIATQKFTVNGRTYSQIFRDTSYIPSNSRTVSSIASATESKNSNSICVHVINQTSQTVKFKFNVGYYPPGTPNGYWMGYGDYPTRNVAAGHTDYFCTPQSVESKKYNLQIKVDAELSGVRDGRVGVDTIYGKY